MTIVLALATLDNVTQIEMTLIAKADKEGYNVSDVLSTNFANVHEPE
jgi:hypothetical protein